MPCMKAEHIHIPSKSRHVGANVILPMYYVKLRSKEFFVYKTVQKVKSQNVNDVTVIKRGVPVQFMRCCRGSVILTPW